MPLHFDQEEAAEELDQVGVLVQEDQREHGLIYLFLVRLYLLVFTTALV